RKQPHSIRIATSIQNGFAGHLHLRTTHSFTMKIQCHFFLYACYSVLLKNPWHKARPQCSPPPQTGQEHSGLVSIRIKGLVEPSGIEPLTSCVQGRRSPS